MAHINHGDRVGSQQEDYCSYITPLGKSPIASAECSKSWLFSAECSRSWFSPVQLTPEIAECSRSWFSPVQHAPVDKGFTTAGPFGRTKHVGRVENKGRDEPETETRTVNYSIYLPNLEKKMSMMDGPHFGNMQHAFKQVEVDEEVDEGFETAGPFGRTKHMGWVENKGHHHKQNTPNNYLVSNNPRQTLDKNNLILNKYRFARALRQRDDHPSADGGLVTSGKNK